MNAFRSLLAFVALSAAQGQTAQPYATVTIGKDGFDVPMEKTDRRLPIVLVKVNGHGPYRFVVDTCAQGGAHLAADVVKEASVASAGEILATDGTGLNPRSVSRYRSDSIEIGEVKWSGVTGIEYKRLPKAGENIDGVLGFGLFARGVLRLDFAKGRVSFREGGLASTMPDTVPLTAANGIAVTTVTVGEEKLAAHLDSGSEGGFALPSDSRARFAPNSPTRVIGKARTQFNEFEVLAAKLEQPVSFGPVKLGGIEAEFIPGLRYVNVGERVMRQFDALEFDQRNGLVRFWQKPAQPTSPSEHAQPL